MKTATRPVSGFTLIELLIVVAMVAVLAMLAAPSLRSIAANQALSSAASDLMSAALQARGASLRYNKRVVVQPIAAADWTSGWQIYVDNNQDAVFDAATDTLLVTQEPLSPTVVGEVFSGSISNLTQFAFEGTGFLFRGAGFNDGTVLLKSNVTTRKKYLVIANSGRARICDPSLAPGCEPT